MTYGPYIIPAYTPVSMANYSAHHDETLFPDSHRFVPDRWLNNAKAPALQTLASASDVEKSLASDSGTDRPLTRYLVSFSKGTRACIGQHLAWAELYIALATVVRRCNLDIHDTLLEDVGFVRDMFVPQPRAGSKGLRVMVLDVDSE
jgi:cytochrome P450